MGFFRFFAYKHPILNFFFQDPDDKIKGFLRRAVILNMLTLTFTFTIVNDQLIFNGEDNTKSDLESLFNDQHVTRHLIVTFFFSVGLIILEKLNEWLYGIAKWDCCQKPCCWYFRGAIYWEALWLFILNVLLYAILLRGKSEIFTGWIITYGLYTVIVSPILILFQWFCMGGKEKEQVRELREQQGDYGDLAQSSSNNKAQPLNGITYA